MIIKYGKKVLRQKSEPVVFPDDTLKDLVAKLYQEGKEVGNAIGVAACQIGVLKRVAAIRYPDHRETKTTTESATSNLSTIEGTIFNEGNKEMVTVYGDVVLINPEIVEVMEEIVVNEGCLSIPGIWQNLKRFERIKVKNYTMAGKEETFVARGILAQAIQHEIDHFNGILFIDHLDKLQKILIENKLKKIK